MFADSLADGSMYSFAVYFGSSVYTSSIDGIMKEFDNIGIVTASLGFALYVLACTSFVDVTMFLTDIFRRYWSHVVVTLERVSCFYLLAPEYDANGLTLESHPLDATQSISRPLRYMSFFVFPRL